jgi:hypothetical protein
MKTTSFLQSLCCWPLIALHLTLVPVLVVPALAQSALPMIADVHIEGTNVVVTADVPAGIRLVTLECRERLGGAWAPRAVARIGGTGGQVTFRLARSRQIELMRVRADASEPLPASFYAGVSSFAEQPSSPGGSIGPGGIVDFRAAPNPPAPPPTREVVESDIWRIRSQTLYFFNQLRGLQVIDISNPDAATVRGTLDLAAAGEDLYLLGANHVVLLTRNGCNYNQSQVLVVTDAGGKPEVAARLPVEGSILESRLVGTALYVAAQSYRPVPGATDSTWEWGTMVSGFDLSDPAAPVSRNTLWYPGYGNVVAATDRLLFVATQDPGSGWQSLLRVIDITNPDGTLRDYESIRTAGRVPDKFKIQWSDSILTTISEDWRSTSTRRVTTQLETFRLPDPQSLGPGGLVKLGELELGRGEQLHATRFDGDRVYVVTFFRIDPLWVVDLSNPSAPRIAGSVDVPGWSTYLQPLGGRLVSIGVESNRVAVSLFDVSNPSAPALLSRVRLGQNYSYSEANWDEKAFGVLPEAGLILVPFSGDTTNGYASSVQLVDLNASSLVARGVIEHQFQPRRATVYAERILSLSGWELLSTDASDRDHPLVRGSTALAWPVDRVILHGNYLLELGSTGGWGFDSGSPVVRVASADAPDRVITQATLTNLALLGATKRGSRLYLAQGQSQWYYPWLPVIGVDGKPIDSSRSQVFLTVIDLNALPAVQITGGAEAKMEGIAVAGELQPVWPSENVLVWSGGGVDGWWWRCLTCPMPLAAEARAGAVWWWPPFSRGGGQLVAFDVSRGDAPRFASAVNLASNDGWNSSQAFAADGKVYLSHQTSEFVAQPLANDLSAVGSTGLADASTDVVVYPPIGTWISRSYLDVVDYADAGGPLVRTPVNIPGALAGLSHNGAVLYTTGTHWTTNSATMWAEYLDASAYDGVSAHLIDSLVLPATWPRPLLVSGTDIFIGRSAGSSPYPVIGPVVPLAEPAGLTGSGAVNEVPSALETWYLSSAGKFQRSGNVTLSTPASALAGFGALLAVQHTDNSVTLFDASNGAALRPVGNGRPGGCLWFDLQHADGAVGRGLWLPLGSYGVARIPAAP